VSASASAPVTPDFDLDRERFERDGFLVLRRLFNAEEMARLSTWTDEVAAWPEVPGRHMVYYEDDRAHAGRRILSRIENYCAYHEGFNRLLNDGPVLSLISALYGERAVLFKDKINFKMPGSDGFKAHQDVQAGWDRYASLHLTLLVSIDEATVENGCLEIVAGMHRSGLLGEMWKPLPEDALAYVACPTEPGDAVVFDSYVPHRSAANRTQRPRRILYVTYNRASEGDHRAQYYADKRLSYPPDIEREPGKRYEFKV
jgi:hypothetical protein